MDISKVQTYLNFAKKSQNILYGVDDIIKSNKVELVIFSENLADSSKNKLKNYIEKKSVSCFVLNYEDFFELVQNTYIKTFAIIDKNLAKAIEMNFTNTVSNGGNLEQNRK